MTRLIVALVALFCLSCSALPISRELRVRPINFTALLIADLQGVARANLRSVGADMVLVDDGSHDIELVFRDAANECGLFGSSIAGALRWQQWRSLPARVEVSTNCSSRGFNQAMSHALLHALDIARDRTRTQMPHIEGSNELLRAPQYEEWQQDRGIEYVYGGSMVSESTTPRDIDHFREM